MAATVRGIRLALTPQRPPREFGIAIYVDFTATAEDWVVYDDWASPTAGGT